MNQTASAWPLKISHTPLAVLASGGLDSSVLLGEAVSAYPSVTPIFVRVGSIWEDAEFDYLKRFIQKLNSPKIKPIVVLQQPVVDLYGKHWSLTGDGVPMIGEPDEASFLPGRNVLLFAKPLLWCLMNNIPELATAPLGSNPFPDATAEFYDSFAESVSRSLNDKVRILRPYSDLNLHKEDVVKRGKDMPLEFTLSCALPVKGHNCGKCSKCGERKDGFKNANIPDRTVYVN
jgi:7-cyano-7-deazaguanine synthase